MEKFIYYNKLFDCYSTLLTEKEKQTFNEYYQENFSLQEIAEEKKVSRSAIQKTIKTVITKLEQYEKNLNLQHLYETLHQLENTTNIEYIHQIIKELLEK